MTSADSSSVDRKFLANAMASFIQIGAVLILLYWCYRIVSPFLPIVIWGVILSVALYPAHVALSARLGGRAGKVIGNDYYSDRYRDHLHSDRVVGRFNDRWFANHCGGT